MTGKARRFHLPVEAVIKIQMDRGCFVTGHTAILS
jgi:hypothetical protein